MVDVLDALDAPSPLPADDDVTTRPPIHRLTAETSRAGELLLAAALVGAGAIHLAMAPSHLDASTLEGVGFLVAGWGQLVLAAALVARSRRSVVWATLGLNVALVAAWAWSRSTGLPFGAHAGEAESVTVVDGVCVGIEAVAIVVAVCLLGRGRIRSALVRSGAVAAVGGIAVLVAATVAIASPSARDHAGGHHGDEVAAADHGHATTDTTGAADDRGFAALQNGQMGDHAHPGGETTRAAEELDPATTGQLAEQLALTAPLVQAYPTIADARAAGYWQAGPYSPGLGVHFSGPGFTPNGDGVMDPDDIAHPTLIYDGLTDDARLAGFMYLAYRETEPEGFAGDLDRWHFHTAVCIVMTPDGIRTPFGADLTGVTREMCEAKGGSLIDFTGYMVHVWTVPGYESELGMFSDLNPKLTCPDGTYYTIPIAELGNGDTTCRNT